MFEDSYAHVSLRPVAKNAAKCAIANPDAPGHMPGQSTQGTTYSSSKQAEKSSAPQMGPSQRANMFDREKWHPPSWCFSVRTML
jgi:hypothetical protein